MKNKKIFIILIILFFTSISVVYAGTYLYYSNEVSYDNSGSSLSSTDVQSALDELYNKSQNETYPTTCPAGYTCTNKSNIKCKRITSSYLHTETCERSSSGCTDAEGNGNTITYGQAGTTGVLLSGDAFDCKVSTTGDYTERFYYVSDYYDTSTKSFNGDVAVLIYYTNTVNGLASTSGVAYDSSGSNYNGPVTAVTHLPTTSTWNNISLYKTSRQILAENNAASVPTEGTYTLPTAFSYSGKAARLLTYKEVDAACYNFSTEITSDGGLNNCNFLYENTQYSVSSNPTYGPWLENPNSANSNYISYMSAINRNVNYDGANLTNYGVRPVIEIPKSQIEY